MQLRATLPAAKRVGIPVTSLVAGVGVIHGAITLATAVLILAQPAVSKMSSIIKQLTTLTAFLFVLAKTPCQAAGHTSCCSASGNACYVSANRCWCDQSCHTNRNCCPDINITCPSSSGKPKLTNPITD